MTKLFEKMYCFVRDCYTNNYRNFRGRSTRAEYFSFLMFQYIVAFLLAYNLETSNSDVVKFTCAIIGTGFGIGSFVPHLALVARRLHDFNLSFGVYVMLWIISIAMLAIVANSKSTILLTFSIALLIILVFGPLFIPGTNGPNNYGEPFSNSKQ